MNKAYPCEIIFAERLKALRLSRNLSQIELANELQVSASTISYYEKMERSPQIFFLQKMSQYFGVTYEYLMGESDVTNNEYESTMQEQVNMDCSQHFSIQTEDGKLSAANLAKFEAESGLNEEGTLVAAPVAVLTLTDNTDSFEVQAKLYIQSMKAPFYEPLIEVTRDDEVIYEEDYNGAITRDSIFYALRKIAMYFMLNEITEEKLELLETNNESVRFKINHNGVFRLEQFITKSEEQIEVTVSRYSHNSNDYRVCRFSIFDTATKTRKDNPIMCHAIADREDENIHNASKKAFGAFDAAMS